LPTETFDCPLVFLGSGQTLKLLKVMLYDKERVQEVTTLRANAAKSLGGGSLGVGVIGSPSWSLFGEAAAISVVGGFLSGILQKQAVEMLQTAQTKSEAVAKRGALIDFSQVTNNHVPHPHVWFAAKEGGQLIHNGDEFVNVQTDSGAMSIRWNQVAAYVPPQPTRG
jgi:hypothetical protein